MRDDELLDAHVQLSETLRDTHYGHSVLEYGRLPTSVEVAKAIGEGTPFVLRGIATTWPAIQTANARRWTNEYLEQKLQANLVTVALTGDGFADAVTWIPSDGREITGSDRVWLPAEVLAEAQYPRRYPNGVGVKGRGAFAFAAPHEQQMPFRTVLEHLTVCQPMGDTTIAYCQLQNDCLRGDEYQALLEDVPNVIPAWASPVLGTEPEAVNFWMGRHESVTSLHSDPFENIYTVIRGCKIFTLYPPCDMFFFHKQPFPTARWLPCLNEDCAGSVGLAKGLLPALPKVALVLDKEYDDAPQTPWIPITHPRKPAPLYPRFASAPAPFVVEVRAGDSLYLPRGWLHQVEQKEDNDGLCIAVNTWYEGWAGMGVSWGWSDYAQKMDELMRNGA